MPASASAVLALGMALGLAAPAALRTRQSLLRQLQPQRHLPAARLQLQAHAVSRGCGPRVPQAQLRRAQACPAPRPASFTDGCRRRGGHPFCCLFMGLSLLPYTSGGHPCCLPAGR